jgi:hypothetical protein
VFGLFWSMVYDIDLFPININSELDWWKQIRLRSKTRNNCFRVLNIKYLRKKVKMKKKIGQDTDGRQRAVRDGCQAARPRRGHGAPPRSSLTTQPKTISSNSL